jgi:DNA-binding protein YbaB
MGDNFEGRMDDARRRLAEVRAAGTAVDASAGAVVGASAGAVVNASASAVVNASAGAAVDGAGPGAATVAIGRAGDDAVEATAVRGRLRTITLAPQLMRRSDAEVAELVIEAVNQALQRSQADMLAGSGTDVPSLAGLETRVEQLRDQGERAMYEIQNGLNRAISKVGDRTGLSGDTSSQGLEQLLGSLADTLRLAQSATRSSPAGATVGGRGTDGDGHVIAEVDGGGSVTELSFGPRAFRLPSIDLAEHVVTAINAALTDVEAAVTAQSTVDFAELRRRVAEVQEASVRQMTQLTTSLTGIMSSIREP